jgi:hypothetical protein
VAAQQTSPIPDAQAQAQAKKAADELYGDRFRGAKSDAEKTALAEEMVETATKMRDGLAG